MKIRAITATLAVLLMASDAQAQYDTPSFLPPRPGDDIGVYASSLGDYAIQGIWRQGGHMNLGVRIGYVDIGDDGAVVVGFDTWGLLMDAGVDLPVDVTWTFGAGAAFNGGTIIEIPVGLSIGRVIELEPVTLQIYGHPRLGLFVEPGAVEPDNELHLDGLFDLGVDAVLDEKLTLRIGATLGGIDAVGLGLAYHWSRGAVVR